MTKDLDKKDSKESLDDFDLWWLEYYQQHLERSMGIYTIRMMKKVARDAWNAQQRVIDQGDYYTKQLEIEKE